MKYLLILFLCAPLLAVKIDPTVSSFEQREHKQRIDVYDFKGEYPDLEKIDIDGRRKKNVEIYLSGNYPLLKKITYDGGFGVLIGELTGDYPELRTVDIKCGDANMELDLRGKWHQSCTINIAGLKENISIDLPTDVGVIVNTKTKLRGKVISNQMKKQGRLQIFNKTFHNDLVQTAPVVVTLNVDLTDGRIILR